MTRDGATSELETRILIDRPIEAVWKRVQDLSRLAEAIDGVQGRDASPTGDTVAVEGFVTVAPYRLRLAGHAAVLDADALTHRATVAVDLRDRGGKGRLTATARVALRPVGSGVEMTLQLEAALAGAIVRAANDALLDQLDAFVRAAFVAIAGDAFTVDEAHDEALLFEPPGMDTDLDHESVDDDEQQEELTDDGLEDAGDDLDPDDETIASNATPNVVDPVIAAIVGTGIPITNRPKTIPLTTPTPVVAPDVVPSVKPSPARAAGLPRESLPKARGLSRYQGRAQRVTQTAGTVAATAAVAAVVAGAFVARRWFGRR